MTNGNQSAPDYDRVFAVTPVPMILLAPDAPRFTILNVNDAYCKTTQVNAAKITGMGLFEVFPDNPEDRSADGRQNVGASLAACIASRKTDKLSTQQYNIREGGSGAYTSRFWNLVSTPVLSDTGMVESIIHSIEDVTTQVKLNTQQQSVKTELADAREEAAIATKAENLLTAILDTVQAGIFLFTPIRNAGNQIVDFRFRTANKMLAAYIGRMPEDVIGSTGGNQFPGYLSNGLFDRLQATAHSGNTDRFEFHYDADGLDVWVDIMCTKVGDDVLVTFTDYTSMKQLQHRLEDHLGQLQSSNANLEQFAYVASHDLQEPLRKIKSFGDMLKSRYANAIDASGADLIARMQSAATRMGTLINDLLMYSRVSVKPANPELVDTAKVLEGVVFDLEQTIRQQKVQIHIARLAPVMGQDTQIGQLFLNILSNAMKFQHPDRVPEINVSAEMVKGRESSLPVKPEDADKLFQRIRITDNGIGFEQEYRDRIFQIFQRLHGRGEYPGTGIGLSIVKKVVENHHGYISADAVPGDGATFTILLPAITA